MVGSVTSTLLKIDILQKLLPGDIVLADRGFDIADSVGYYQARLHIPAFTRGKKKLPWKLSTLGKLLMFVFMWKE